MRTAPQTVMLYNSLLVGSIAERLVVLFVRLFRRLLCRHIHKNLATQTTNKQTNNCGELVAQTNKPTDSEPRQRRHVEGRATKAVKCVYVREGCVRPRW
jgi:hypothetical protein